MNLYQHAKNQAISLICSGDMIDLLSCNLIGWEHFGLYLRNNFHYRSTSVKINDQIFQQIQKTLFLALFGSIFPIFGGKIFFPENPVLSRTTPYEFLAPCQNLEKINDTIPRKCLDRQKDGQILFHRTLPATARGPIKGALK